MPGFLIAALLAFQAVPSTRTYLYKHPGPKLFISSSWTSIDLPPIDTDVSWTEAVPSWNVDKPESAELTVEARVIYPDRTTKFYSFGTWSGSSLIGARASVKGQKDEDGNVLTDTLRMARPRGKIQFRLSGRGRPGMPAASLLRLFVNVADTGAASPLDSIAAGPVWGTVLDPPQRAQGDYPGGKGLCSPASVSMVLGYWAGRTGRKALDVPVPNIQSAVYDAVYEGTGNWSFNVAFAGSKPGMLAYAARLNGLQDLEGWIAKGVPVVCSVSWYLLHGEPLADDEEGHLIVLNGFLPNGDPVFNDPGKRGEVRKVYKRSDFEAAWNYSKRTVYIICPPKFAEDAVTIVGG